MLTTVSLFSILFFTANNLYGDVFFDYTVDVTSETRKYCIQSLYSASPTPEATFESNSAQLFSSQIKRKGGGVKNLVTLSLYLSLTVVKGK